MSFIILFSKDCPLCNFIFFVWSELVYIIVTLCMPSALTNNQYHGREAYTLQPFVLLLIFLDVLASLLSCWSLFASQPTFVLQIAWRHLIQLALVDALRSSCMFLVAETFLQRWIVEWFLCLYLLSKDSRMYELWEDLWMIFVWLLKFLWIFVMNLCFKKKKIVTVLW